MVETSSRMLHAHMPRHVPPPCRGRHAASRLAAILSPLPLFALLVTSLWLMCGEKPVPAVKRPALPVFGAPPAAKALF